VKPVLCVEYLTPEQIRARLSVLYEKGDRISRYRETRDQFVLDAKQLHLMRHYHRVPGRDPFPGFIAKTLGRTIDVLEARLRLVEEREAA
jgi:hypothetical protein